MDEFNHYVPVDDMMERKRIEDEIQRLTERLNKFGKWKFDYVVIITAYNRTNQLV